MMETATASIDVVKKFDALCNEGKFEEASTMLADDFHFTNPMASLDKTCWLKKFPALKPNLPSFDQFQQGAKSNQVTHVGKKKILMMNLKMIETWEVTNEGKIKSITGVKQ